MACYNGHIEVVRLLLTLTLEYENEIYEFMLDDPFILIRILNINNEYKNKLEHSRDYIPSIARSREVDGSVKFRSLGFPIQLKN